MNTVKVKFIKEASNHIKVELVSNKKELNLPKRVFEKRVDMGIYEVVNPQKVSTII